MRYSEGALFEVNGWTTRMGSEMKFVHLLRVRNIHSENHSEGIRVEYVLERVDENGERVDDRTITRSTSGNECPIPNTLNYAESLEEAELDKERPTMDAHCSHCSSVAETKFMWVYDKLNHGRAHHQYGAPQCSNCSYTYFKSCEERLPSGLIKEAKRRVKENEASEMLEEWVKKDSRVHGLDDTND